MFNNKNCYFGQKLMFVSIWLWQLWWATPTPQSSRSRRRSSSNRSNVKSNKKVEYKCLYRNHPSLPPCVAVGQGDHVHGAVHPATQVQGVPGGLLHHGRLYAPRSTWRPTPSRKVICTREYLEAYPIMVGYMHQGVTGRLIHHGKLYLPRSTTEPRRCADLVNPVTLYP